jgi:hypothetical protein
MKRDRHTEIVERKMRKGTTYRRSFERTLHQIDLALLVREMREENRHDAICNRSLGGCRIHRPFPGHA